MKFGLAYASSWPFNTAHGARRLAVAAEAAGFESVWAIEHVVWPTAYESTYPYSRSGKMPGEPAVSVPDPVVWLTWAGAHTARIRLGTGVLILPLRDPLVTAKALATLDDFTGGRVEAGVGVGWLQEEFEAVGVPFAGRGRRAEDYVGAMRAVWGGDDAAYTGEFTAFSGVNVNPKPARGTIPVTIGGHSLAAAERAGRIGDGFFPGRSDPDELDGLYRAVRASAEAHGRDPEAITLSGGLPRGGYDDPGPAIAHLAGMGVTRVLIPAFMAARPDLDTGMEKMQALIEGFGEPSTST
jgi:probable F420-dependent oxidoreductase